MDFFFHFKMKIRQVNLNARVADVGSPLKRNWSCRFHLGDILGSAYGVQGPWKELWGLINAVLPSD